MINIAIVDDNIAFKELGKCNQGIFPIGRVISYENRESGEIVTEKISLGKRKKWLQILSEKTGL